eukprot:g1639.t1
MRVSTSIPKPGSPVRGSKTGKPIMALFDLLGRSWALGVIWQLSEESLTFRELQGRCEGVSPTVLNKRLKELRECALVNHDGAGYVLTPMGQQLFGLLKPFGNWSNRKTQEIRAMALPDFTMRQLLEAGVHFGHQKHRWNPRMGQYIFGVRNDVHIMDLSQTVPLLHQALKAVSDTVAGGGRVLLVGTKRQAQEAVASSARNSAQYFVNARWLGGMLTNWKTISQSIQRLRKLEETLSSDAANALTKKERLFMDREREKLERNLGGIKDMGGIPDLIFVIDTNREAIAIQEARRLGIPVAAILDSNSNPDGITYPVPGNDDAGRAISLYCDLIARAAIDGISRAQGAAGMDIGESDEAPVEEVLAAESEEAPAEAAEAAPAEEAAAAQA